MATTSAERYRPDLLELAAGYAEDSVIVTTANLDAPGPQILYVNSAFARLMGYSASELLGKTPRLFQGPKTDRAKLAQLRIDLSSGKDFIARTINYRRSGEEFEIEWIISHIRDDSGKTTHYVAIQRDITGRQFAEAEIHNRDEELRETSAQLLQTLRELELAQQHLAHRERLVALGKMAAGVVHDLNNTLSPMVNVIEVLERSGDLADPVRDGLNALRFSVGHVRELVDNLGKFYENNEVRERTAEVDLTALLKEIPNITRSKWQTESRLSGSDIDFDLELSAAPLIQGSETELRQMIVNLVFNAVDAMPDGGRIRLRLASVDDQVIIDVEDSGTGFSEEAMRHAFDPYFTSKPEGTGLGLSVCYGIATRHGGTIVAERSTIGGAMLRISLPVAVNEDLSGNKRLRVLHIDDDEFARDSLAALIKSFGHEVDVASNGDEGIEMFYRGDYDCVITDLAMTPTSGVDVTIVIKQSNSSIPVVLMSGSVPRLVGSRFTAGIAPDVILDKPIETDQLQQTLNRFATQS